MTAIRVHSRSQAAAGRAARRIRHWQMWTLPRMAAGYVLVIDTAAVCAIAVAATQARWHGPDILLAVALVASGIVAIEAGRGVRETHGETIRDFGAVWLLAIAISLPPFFALAAPAALTAYKLLRLPGMVVYRRVASAATLSLAFGLASVVFRSIPGSVAGAVPGTARHALTWAACAAGCCLLALIINIALVVSAIRLSGSSARVRELVATRQTLTLDLLELCLAVSVTLVVRINPILVVLVLPVVVLCRRTILQAQLVAPARIDPGTGLLNARAWHREAQAEFLRAVRTGAPLAMAVVAIDSFSSLTESADPAVAAQLTRGVAGVLKEQLPAQAIIGRRGSNRFAVLMQADRGEARRVSELLRDRIAGEPIAVDDGQAAYVFRPTVSIGLAVLNRACRSVGELAEAASVALGKATGPAWNTVYGPSGDVGDLG